MYSIDVLQYLRVILDNQASLLIHLVWGEICEGGEWGWVVVALGSGVFYFVFDQIQILLIKEITAISRIPNYWNIEHQLSGQRNMPRLTQYEEHTELQQKKLLLMKTIKPSLVWSGKFCRVTLISWYFLKWLSTIFWGIATTTFQQALFFCFNFTVRPHANLKFPFKPVFTSFWDPSLTIVNLCILELNSVLMAWHTTMASKGHFSINGPEIPLSYQKSASFITYHSNHFYPYIKW